MNNKENNIKNLENGGESKDINIKNKIGLNKEIKNNNNIKEEKEIQQEKDTEQLSQSLKNLFLMDKDFSAPVEIKKENKLLTDFHYATFKNSYGENTCYINVILHLLYNIEQLEAFIISLYEIDESNKNNSTQKSKNTPEETNDTYKFLVLIGRILFEYREIIFDESEEEILTKTKENKQVSIINTLRMRKMLAKISKNKFPLNTIADPVEFFSFILDILNEYLNEDIHKTFYLELIDEYTCNKKGCSQIYNKYDKDNFMYHIYIDEILKYIEKENIKVNDYKNKLFEFSHYLFLSENSKICEKCKEKMNHNLICRNMPDYILINCVWKESNPIVDDAMTIFFMMPIKDEFNNLFISQTKNYKKKLYQLFGFILYSFTLSHYIICIYNIDKNVFVLLNDEIVKEFHNIYELLIDITVEELKSSGKAFFYPVMLIYTKDSLYNNKNMRINTLNDSEYKRIINNCNDAIYQYEMQNKINDEMKENNYKEFLKEQKEIENEIKRSVRYESYLKKKRPEIKFENQNKEIKKKIDFEEERKNIIEEQKDNKKEQRDIKEKTLDIIDYQSKIKENGEEKNILKDDIKIGLNQKNMSTIGKILKDIKNVNGNNLSNNLYLGDIIKSNKNFDIENKNIDTKKRTNYLYQSNIVWNKGVNNRERNKMQNSENKLEAENDNIKNETSINSRKERFHRNINSGINNSSNNNYYNYSYREEKDNNRNFSSNINNKTTQINKRYHYKKNIFYQ